MTAAPAPRRPLERVALTLLSERGPGGPARATGLVSVIDAGDLGGRAVELSRLLALHSAMPTLLVEANLRTPSRLAAAMEMDAGPGVLDALRTPDRADEMVRATPDPRLWVMTAGTGAPTYAPVGLADFGDVMGTVRVGRWAVPRRVVDIRDSHPDPTPALVTVGAPAVDQAEESEGELRPFNEGPPSQVERGPLPPLPAPTRRAAAPPSAPRRIPSIVVVSPPLDDRSDGDVVVAQCDRVLLLVHAGEVSREQVADAADRVGPERLVGTVVVMPPQRRRRS